jgi:hypothetical protein
MLNDTIQQAIPSGHSILFGSSIRAPIPPPPLIQEN